MVGVTYSTRSRVATAACAVKARVKFKKLLEEDENLENESEPESDQSNRKLGKGEKKNCCKKCKSTFNSVAAIVVAISVFCPKFAGLYDCCTEREGSSATFLYW